MLPPGERKFDIQNLVEDSIALLDFYAIDACTIFGMSLGGMVAQLVAIQYPARVKSLILLASSVRDDTCDLPQIDEKVLNYHAIAERLE